MSKLGSLTRLLSRLASAQIMAIVVFLASGWIAVEKLDTFRANGVQPRFYQNEFEPAVMLACGRGWVTIAPNHQPPALSAFLKVDRDDFDCAALPADLAVVPAEGNPLSMAGGMTSVYYLFHSTAAWWRLMGLSWTALDGLVALLVGVSAVAAYGLLQLAATPWIAAAITLMLTASPKYSVEMLSLRSYSKGTFILLALLILAHLLRRPMSLRPMLALALAGGVTIGVGYGFRSDVLVMLPLGLFATLFLLPGPAAAKAARNGLVSITLLAGFGAALWPATRGTSSGGCQFHVTLLGISASRVGELGLSPAIYNFGSPYSDTFTSLKVDEYAAHTLKEPAPLLCSAEYDAASARLYWDISKTFPGDVVARGYGSALAILSRGFEIASPGQLGEFAALNQVTRWLSPFGPLLTVLAVAVVWARSTRLGIATAVAMLYLAAYPAIEFEDRHWFHLRFLPWWSLLVVAGAVVKRGGIPRQDFARGALAVVGLIGALVVLLGTARAVQARTAGDLFSAYESATVEDVEFGPAAQSFVPVTLGAYDTSEDESRPAARRSDFLVLSLDPAQCQGPAPVSIRIDYEANAPSHDLSSNVELTTTGADGGPTRLFVPVFADGVGDATHLRFTGFEVVGASSGCISRVQEVTGDARSLLRLEAQLPADWRARPLYQRISYPTPR